MRVRVRRPLARLTRRQAAGLVAVAVLVVAVALAGAGGHPNLALVALGPLGAVIFIGVLQVRRRGGEAHRLLVDLVRYQTGRVHVAVKMARAEEGRSLNAAATQRRILASIESERLAASDRQRELTRAIDRLRDDMAARQRDLVDAAAALWQLFRLVEPRAPMPSPETWGTRATTLLELLLLIGQQRPKMVLQVGGRTSAIWIAYALERNGGRLVSVDHDPHGVDRTRSLLSTHGLADAAEVRFAPPRPLTIAGEDVHWYDLDAFADVGDIDLLLVDGPPDRSGPCTSFPALPVLEGRLSDTATVVLDDPRISDEENVVRRWTESVAGLTRIPHTVSRQAVMVYSRYGSAG
jgi:predicted O-methyltransferase YrrM